MQAPLSTKKGGKEVGWGEQNQNNLTEKHIREIQVPDDKQITAGKETAKWSCPFKSSSTVNQPIWRSCLGTLLWAHVWRQSRSHRIHVIHPFSNWHYVWPPVISVLTSLKMFFFISFKCLSFLSECISLFKADNPNLPLNWENSPTILNRCGIPEKQKLHFSV